jgi:1-acyl-sn-glycerol-3-phosphate acyltransferase
MQALRATLRLTRAAAHLLHGMFIVAWRFAAYTPARRQQRIGWWSAKLLRCLGLELVVEGPVQSPQGRALLVANHLSWLDIAAIHAVLPHARFVSKADVLAWPLVGRMVAGAGTLFIERERARDALRVVKQMTQALEEEHTVAVFPEGTTGEGETLLPFHANLMQAALNARAPVQPVLLQFLERDGRSISRAALYVGETTLLQSAWRLACAPRTVVRVRCLALITPEDPSAWADRRALAQRAREDLSEALRALQDAR